MNGHNGVNAPVTATRKGQGDVTVPMPCLEEKTVWDTLRKRQKSILALVEIAALVI